MEELLAYIDELEKEQYFYIRKKDLVLKDVVDTLISLSKCAKQELEDERRHDTVDV